MGDATYTSRQVREILGLSEAGLKRLVGVGFVSPGRGTRREYRFTFQDLILLRTAKGLADAQLPPRRIAASLKRIRAELPSQLPLSGLRISAGHDAVVVSEAAGGQSAQWQAHDGQYLLAFEVVSPGGQVRFVEAAAGTPDTVASPGDDAAQLFAQAYALEADDPEAALAAYAEALKCNACLPGAHANRGRLLHELGRLDEAEAAYESGMRRCPGDALLLFNFAVLREDQQRPDEAIRLYQAALGEDASMADAHYNLGLLHQAAGRQREALRHFNAYRKLESA
jgi:tetratricopeptide (TPR) repeat protein